MYTHEDIIVSLLINFRASTPKAIEFRSELGLKQHDTVLSKERSEISTITKLFLNEKILLQHSVLDYKTNWYFLSKISNRS